MAEELDRAERNAIEIISHVGWMVMKVSPNAGDERPESFAYTAGLAVTFRWPELICFGLDLDVAGELLNNAVRELQGKSLQPVSGLELSDVADGRVMRLRTFSPGLYREHLGWAIWYADYSGLTPAQFSCLQLLWPDKAGRFPGDPACDPGVAAAQANAPTH
jgi:Domain of unknown function (DUF4262)